MFSQYVLDTNAFYSLLNPTSPFNLNLKLKLQVDTNYPLYLPEISSMEIFSVIGKYRRGGVENVERCNRFIESDEGPVRCSHTWIPQKRRRLSKSAYRDMLKLVKDIVSKKGDIVADIIPLDSHSIQVGKDILFKYADTHSFGSHDALIAGTLIECQKSLGKDMTMVTSDRGLKAVLAKEGVKVFDPQKDAPEIAAT
jgi:predicted nucleic acid-binding protein